MDVEGRGRGSGRRRRPAVMSDVGRLAGVSHQTVSRVINGSPKVRPETRRRVIAAMRELDYRPNTVARALVTGRTYTLGVVGFDTTLYGPASVLFGPAGLPWSAQVGISSSLRLRFRSIDAAWWRGRDVAADPRQDCERA